MSSADAARRRTKLERARLTRYLKRGGVIVRDVCGGVVGVRWCRATRSGVDYDASVCEDRLAAGRLQPVQGSRAAFKAPPPLMMA